LVLRAARHDRHGWVTCVDLFLNVSEEPVRQFAARLDLVWRRVEKSAHGEPQPEPQNDVQESPSLNLILDEPEPQNEVLPIRMNLERESGKSDCLPKSSKKKRVLPTQAEVEAGFTEWWSRYPRKDDKLDAKRAYKAIVTGAHRDPECRASIPQLLAALKVHKFPKERQFIKQPATWLNKGAWASADVDALGDDVDEAQAQHTAANDAAKRKLQEARDEMVREEEAEVEKQREAEAKAAQAKRRAQQSAGRRSRPGLSVKEQLGKMNQAVQEGSQGPAHQPAEPEGRAHNVA
jgi:hypothetical protein